MEEFVAQLVQRVPNKHASLSSRSEFSLVRAKAMNIGCVAEHSKGDIGDETDGGIGFLETS